MGFADRLREATLTHSSVLCLGLDPHGAQDAAAAERHCLELLDAVLGEVCAVKPNIAFFECFGSAGYGVLERLRERIPADVLYIVDGKRGDIGSTGLAYATALYDVLGADCVTVNPLMGRDCVAALWRPGRGLFVLSRTSNPGAADFLLRPSGDRPLYQEVVAAALGWEEMTGDIGFVVGATDTGAVAAVRSLAPDAPLLVPGVGAQGGDLEATVAAGLAGGGGGLVVPLSRGISGAAEGPREAARRLRRRIEEIRAGAAPAH